MFTQRSLKEVVLGGKQTQKSPLKKKEIQETTTSPFPLLIQYEM